MRNLAPPPPTAQHPPSTLAATIAAGMLASGIGADEITAALERLPESASVASSRQVARRLEREQQKRAKVHGIGPRRARAALERGRGVLDDEPAEHVVETRGRAELERDPWQRPSSRAFLEACEKAARHAGEAWTPPPQVPRRVWIGTNAIAVSGRTARYALLELPRSYAAIVRAAIRAAGVMLGHITARLLVAFAWATWRMSIRARRRGYARKVEGIPRGLWCSLAMNAQSGERYSVGRLFGTDTNAGPGIMVQLERAGLFLKLQTPAYKAPARLKGPSGHAFNVYWIPTTAPVAVDPDDVPPPRAPAAAPSRPSSIADAPPPS